MSEARPQNELMVTRLSGAGNTFFLVDGFESKISEIEAQNLAVRICRDTPGMETDGLFVIEKDSEADFRWTFFNDDGSRPRMCGNAARCAGLYWALKSKFKKPSFKFKTLAGLVTGEVLGSIPDENGNYPVAVELPELKNTGGAIQIGTEELFFINTGVPHLVVVEEPLISRAEILRSAKELGTEGANVTFVNQNKAVSFERGVEDFTLACGTGAIAAAAFLRKKQGGQKQIIEMPGGTLTVEWLSDLRPRLTGPARVDGQTKVERI